MSRCRKRLRSQIMATMQPCMRPHQQHQLLSRVRRIWETELRLCTTSLSYELLLSTNLSNELLLSTWFSCTNSGELSDLEQLLAEPTPRLTPQTLAKVSGPRM